MNSCKALRVAAAAAVLTCCQMPAAISEEPGLAQPVSLQQVWHEVKAVRLQLNLLQAEYLERIIVALDGEAARVRERLRKLDKSEENLRGAIASAPQYAATSESERLQVEEYSASRELRPGSDLVVLLAEKEALSRRESDLAQQIEFERRRWQAALDTANNMQAELARIQSSSAGR